LQHIQFGRDSPFLNICGGIQDLWARLEIQNEEDGEVPHCHATLHFRNLPDTPDKNLSMLNLIRCCVETFACKEEEKELIDKGFASDPDLMLTFLRDMQTKLTHWCVARCTIQNRIVESDGSVTVRKERKCKQPDCRRMSANPMVHAFMDVNVSHSQQASHALTSLGMIETGHDIHVPGIIEKCIPKPEFRHLLETKRHLPPCCATDHRCSPANPFLFAVLLSAMNLQFCTACVLLRYLAKHVAAVDKSTRIVFKASEDVNNERNIRVNAEQGQNAKITGNSIAKKDKDSKNRDSQFQFHGRAISSAEQTVQLLRHGSIITSFQIKGIDLLPRMTLPTKGLGATMSSLIKVHKSLHQLQQTCSKTAISERWHQKTKRLVLLRQTKRVRANPTCVIGCSQRTRVRFLPCPA
jgi:hypothetical protein